MRNLIGNTKRSLTIAVVLVAQSIPVMAEVTMPSVAQPAPEDAGSQGMTLPGFEWQLPCETKLSGSGQRMNGTASGTVLKGSISESNIDSDFSGLIDVMLDGALATNPQKAKLDKAVARFRRDRAEFIDKAKDAANSALCFRGFGPSSEAADVILDEKIKVKDKHSAEYARQRLIDELHPQVVAKTMNLAMAMGLKNPVERDQAVSSAMGNLEALVGKNGAQMAYSKLDEWGKLQIPESVYGGARSWDVEAFQTKQRQVTKLAMDGDPVMKQIVERLKKYHHTPLTNGSSKVVESGLAIGTWIAPGYLVPLALEAINVGYIFATGGTEEHKLIKELYYDKRVESRYRTVNEEASMALSQYQNAAHSQNAVLMMCCESVLTQLVGPENISSILGPRTLLAHELAPAAVAETAKKPARSLTAASPNQSLQ